MTWGWPEALSALWLVPICALLLAGALRRRRADLARLGPLFAGRASAGAARVHAGRAVLWCGGLCLALVALAQPRWGWRWVELKRKGLDLVVVLDVSASMDATDVAPSRMERARREVLDLTELLGGDRVGLVVFAGGAYPRMPLTLDYAVLRQVVRDSGSQTLVAQGSDLGAALRAGAQLLGPPGEADRALLVLTDGEDHAGAAREAAAEVAEAGVRIFTVGVGTADGAPIPLPGGGFKKDRAGRMVLSRLDEPLLKDLARAGQGAYVRSGGGNQDLVALYEGELKGRLQAAEDGLRRDKVWDERYQWPLAAAFVLFLAGGLLRPGPLRLPGAALGLALALTVPARADEAAVRRLAAEQAARPDDLGLAERLGGALFDEGRFTEAQRIFADVAARSADPVQRQRARYNEGLAAYRAGRLRAAARSWEQVLSERPEHPAARGNLDAVERELQAREAPPPEDQGQPQAGQPQPGEPQPGQPQPGEPQPGEPQPGEPQPGDPQPGDPPPGDPAEGPPPQGRSAPGAAPPPTDGTRSGGGEPTDTGDRGELQARGDGAAPDGSPAPPPIDAGATSAEAAARAVDSVKEGTPRVRARPRPSGEQDW